MKSFSVSFLLSVALIPSAIHTGEITDLATDCGSTKASVTKLTMEECDQNVDTVCKVTKGDVANGTLEFTATANIEKLDCSLGAVMNPVFPAIPFPCDVPDGCKSLIGEAKCPIEQGQVVIYQVSMKIKQFMPTVELVGRWMLKDGNETAVCFEMPMKIIETEQNSITIVKDSTTKGQPTTTTPQHEGCTTAESGAMRTTWGGTLIVVMVMIHWKNSF